jgi:hypothetical protein
MSDFPFSRIETWITVLVTVCIYTYSTGHLVICGLSEGKVAVSCTVSSPLGSYTILHFPLMCGSADITCRHAEWEGLEGSSAGTLQASCSRGALLCMLLNCEQLRLSINKLGLVAPLLPLDKAQSTRRGWAKLCTQ